MTPRQIELALLARHHLRQPRPQLGQCRRASMGRQRLRMDRMIEHGLALSPKRRALSLRVVARVEVVDRERQIVLLPGRRLACGLGDRLYDALDALGEVPACGLLGFEGEAIHGGGVA